MKKNIVIRLEEKSEYRKVENLVRDSFWNVYRPGCLEHYVINQLRNDPAFVPELISDLHKFMDYYLPTTVKLLKAYEELDKQPVEGENIKTAKQEIENTLDTINEAFENLLDSFFRNTAWDVSTDISVLKTMLAQEGLTGNKDFESVSGKEN